MGTQCAFITGGLGEGNTWTDRRTTSSTQGQEDAVRGTEDLWTCGQSSEYTLTSVLFGMWNTVLNCIDPHCCETSGSGNSVSQVATKAMVFSRGEQCLLNFQTKVEPSSIHVGVTVLEEVVYKNRLEKVPLYKQSRVRF